MDGSHVRTLERALEVIGTRDDLATALEVSVPDLDIYLAGDKPLPNKIFFQALDIVANARR